MKSEELSSLLAEMKRAVRDFDEAERRFGLGEGTKAEAADAYRRSQESVRAVANAVASTTDAGADLLLHFPSGKVLRCREYVGLFNETQVRFTDAANAACGCDLLGVERFEVVGREPAPLRFLSNVHDPKDPRARMYMVYSTDAFADPAARELEWKYHADWVNSNVIGEPQGTEAYTSEQLKAMGLVGLYAKE